MKAHSTENIHSASFVDLCELEDWLSWEQIGKKIADTPRHDDHCVNWAYLLECAAV